MRYLVCRTCPTNHVLWRALVLEKNRGWRILGKYVMYVRTHIQGVVVEDKNGFLNYFTRNGTWVRGTICFPRIRVETLLRQELERLHTPEKVVFITKCGVQYVVH